MTANPYKLLKQKDIIQILDGDTSFGELLYEDNSIIRRELPTCCVARLAIAHADERASAVQGDVIKNEPIDNW